MTIDHARRLHRAARHALPERRRQADLAFETTGGIYPRSSLWERRERSQKRLFQAYRRLHQATQILEPLQPITRAQQRNTDTWWKDKELILLDTIHLQSGHSLQAGRRVSVLRKYKGLTVRAAYCGHCGTAFHAKEVPYKLLAWPPASPSP